MDDEWSANFGIFTENPFDVESPMIDKFATKVTNLVPELDTVELDKAKKTWRLIQAARKGHPRLPREIEIDSGGLVAAAGSGLSPAERVAFLRGVSSAAEQLEISKFNTSVVDLKYIFRIPHWGNHHDLIANTLLSHSPLSGLAQKVSGAIVGLELRTTVRIPGEENLLCVITVRPQTTRDEIQRGEYDGDDIRVVCGIARVSDFWKAGTFEDMFVELHQTWQDHLKKVIVGDFVLPIKQNAVSSKPLNDSE